ncbi:ubiquitin-conjugating enzyme family protein (macronuclear) [Tetrahymena thermophila SB210]|uniref:Ubiquitin-conjugating enzyme family protein n=1 Tax=Tetrahymena thermophila (strain SB210) TaxID=312017 RepID=Q24CX0_TETTS|nr:ubiquitin-conjugating enzyme family protein [Tetrahymena thermophila SB210]EAS05638.2 ubiquitin-conjugating enzyme family protein [Tetrahymena thermophila SB210]|eukprot:XP_001025883.2 ubiquitin-conjugating enzyme family protein [Tetrahymena thermophila SB210]
MFSNKEETNKQNFIVGLLQAIDIFGVGINIRFNQQSKHTTGFGGLITLALTSLLLILFISSIQNIIKKSNPSVIYQEDFISNPSQYNLTNENFSFAITLLDANFNPINDKSIFRIEGNFLYKEPQINSDGSVGEPVFKNKVIEFELCTEQSFQVQGTESYFLSLQYQNMYCFKNIDDYYLVGQFEMDQFSVIQINVIPCDQSDPNNQVQCMEESKKNLILSQSLLQVYYITQVVQVSSKQQPFKPMGITYFWENNIDFLQNVNLMFIKTYVQDDDGLIFENNIQNSSLLFSSERTMMSSKKDFSIYQISLYLEKNKEKTYIRKYQKIFECFSSIGGIYNVLFAIGCILAQPYSQIQLNRKLFNETFQVSNNNQDNLLNESQSSNKSSKTNKTDNNMEVKNKTIGNQADLSCKSNKYKAKKLEKANRFFQNCLEEAEMQNEEQKKSIKDMFKQKFLGIKIKSREYLAYYFNCFKICKNEMFEIVNFGTKQILNYTDICFIVNKLIELEKLKALLLNEQQIQLFDFIPKPQIGISIIREIQQNQNDGIPKIKLLNAIQQQQDKTKEIKSENQSGLNKQFNILSIQKKSTYEKAKDAQQAFNQIYRDKQKYSKIDLKLIQLLDQELVELFDGNVFQENNLLTNMSSNQQIIKVKQKQNHYYSPISTRHDRLLSNKSPTQFSNAFNFNEELKNRKHNDEDFFLSENVTETDTKLQTYYPRAKNFIQITNLRNLSIEKEIESLNLQKQALQN